MNEIQNKMSKIVLIVSSFFFLLCFVMGFFFSRIIFRYVTDCFEY